MLSVALERAQRETGIDQRGDQLVGRARCTFRDEGCEERGHAPALEEVDLASEHRAHVASAPADAADQTVLSAVRFESELQAFIYAPSQDDLSTADLSRDELQLALTNLQRARLTDREDQYLAAQLRIAGSELQSQSQVAEDIARRSRPEVAIDFINRYLRVGVAGTSGSAERLRVRLLRRASEIRGQISRRDENLSHSLIGTFGLIGLAGVMLAVFCVRLVTEPVGRLSFAARAVEKGDYTLALQLGEQMVGGHQSTSQNELTILTRAFTHMAGALDEREGRLRSQAERLLAVNSQLTALQSLTDIALADLPVPSLVEQLLQRTIAGIGGQAGAVFLRDPSSGRLEPRSFVHAEHGEGIVLSSAGAEDLAARVMGEGKLFVCADIRQDPTAPPALAGRGVGSYLAVPIRLHDQVVGAAHVEFAQPQSFTPMAVSLMQVLQERLERALERTRALEELEARGRELQRQVEQKQGQLLRAERLASIGLLGGGIAHELRNPLGVISNAVYFIKQRLDSVDEKARRHLEIVEREVRHSVKIIENLVDFSMGIVPATTRLNLNGIIRDALEFAPVPEGVAVSLSLDPDLPGIVGDETQLLQVIEHLVRNAAQAMEGNGQLRIATGTSAEAVWATVEDSGPGVPLENQSRIFEPLISTRVKGMGLGLALARKILGAHGGDIRLISEPGHGAIFLVELPVTEKPPIPIPDSQTQTVSSLGS